MSAWSILSDVFVQSPETRIPRAAHVRSPPIPREATRRHVHFTSWSASAQAERDRQASTMPDIPLIPAYLTRAPCGGVRDQSKNHDVRTTSRHVRETGYQFPGRVEVGGGMSPEAEGGWTWSRHSASQSYDGR